MDVSEALLDSWDRNCRIMDAIAGLVDEGTRKLTPSPDSWPLDKQLAHIHLTRHYFLKNVAPEVGKGIESSFVDGWQTPIDDLPKIKSLLQQSGRAVRDVVKEGLRKEIGQAGWYDNIILFLQHQVWHEGWHAGQILLALRLAGKEPPEEWEEEKIWGEWRTEVWEG